MSLKPVPTIIQIIIRSFYINFPSGILLTSIVWRKWVGDLRSLCFLDVLTVAVRSASMIRGKRRHYQSVCHLSSCLHHQEQSSLCLPAPSAAPPDCICILSDLKRCIRPLEWSSEVHIDCCCPDWASQLRCKHIRTHSAQNYLSCCQVRLEIKHWRIAQISLRIQLPQFLRVQLNQSLIRMLCVPVSLQTQIHSRFSFLSSKTSVKRKPISSK